MKLLLSLSLLFNLVLGAGLIVSLTREPEIVTQTERVVVKEYVNPNIDLESKLIRLEADLTLLKEEHAEELQVMANELAQADVTIAEMQQGLLPPLVIPSTAEEYGKAMGDLQRELILLRKKYPRGRPDIGTEEFDEYVNTVTLFQQDYIPLALHLGNLRKLPVSDAKREAYVVSHVGAALALDDDAQGKVGRIVGDYYAQMRETKLLSDNEIQQVELQKMSQEAYEKVKGSLPPEQQVDFEIIFRRNDFLYNLHSSYGF